MPGMLAVLLDYDPVVHVEIGPLSVSPHGLGIAIGFLLVLALDAFALKLASDLLEETFIVDSFGWALLAALIVAAVSVALEVLFGTNDDDTYSLRVVQRIARRQGGGAETDGARGGGGLKTPLNSPWDIFIAGNTGYIAMAGPHQIWTIDLRTNRADPLAGSGQLEVSTRALMSAPTTQ